MWTATLRTTESTTCGQYASRATRGVPLWIKAAGVVMTSAMLACSDPVQPPTVLCLSMVDSISGDTIPVLCSREPAG